MTTHRQAVQTARDTYARWTTWDNATPDSFTTMPEPRPNANELAAALGTLLAVVDDHQFFDGDRVATGPDSPNYNGTIIGTDQSTVRVRYDSGGEGIVETTTVRHLTTDTA